MGLFKKESCCLCGEKTGMLDKKCMDGKICKECVGKLSVWFKNHKNATTSTLKNQIEQKEKDMETIKTCNFSKVFGEFGVILIGQLPTT